jgi:hypothetical protein
MKVYLCATASPKVKTAVQIHVCIFRINYSVVIIMYYTYYTALRVCVLDILCVRVPRFERTPAAPQDVYKYMYSRRCAQEKKFDFIIMCTYTSSRNYMYMLHATCMHTRR